MEPLPNSPDFRALFLLRPGITFLNHGSFGACPRPVFERYQTRQRELEDQPVEFLGRRLEELMREARAHLGAYLNADRDDVVFQPNSTTALNLVSRSLKLEAGDEVVGTDHEYGALDRTWRFMTARRGARYVLAEIPVPVTCASDVVERVWSYVTRRTRVLFVSHVTSSTALTLPVAKLCARARAAGIISVVDGAHAPSYLALDMRDVDADFYAGNCHKWLCAPKGSAFLYARRNMQAQLEPLVVGWGWECERPSGSRFIDENEDQGTRDVSAYLSVSAAIDFQREHGWDAVRLSCVSLVTQARERITAITGLQPLAPRELNAQMCALPLPACDVEMLKKRLYDDHQIEIPVYLWKERPYIRISVQAYNTQEDVDRLIDALSILL